MHEPLNALAARGLVTPCITKHIAHLQLLDIAVRVNRKSFWLALLPVFILRIIQNTPEKHEDIGLVSC